MRERRLLALLLTACACVGGSGAPAGPLEGDDPFAMVPRATSEGAAPAAAEVRAKVPAPPAPGDSGGFYLAINKSEIGKRWFLIPYLNAVYPWSVGGLSFSASVLGTRVVTFRVENGRLFMFDASDLYHISEYDDPEIVIDSYPIIDHPASLPGYDGDASKYYVFDPTGGRNQFHLFGQAVGDRLTIDQSYMQRFRKLPGGDGVSYEQVVSGTARFQAGVFYFNNNAAIDDTVEYEAAGTLGVTLKRYSEGADYAITPQPPRDFYFTTDGTELFDQGIVQPIVNKWNIHPGMKPIHWLISNKILDYQHDPSYAQYDLFGALKRGIESWNAVFGFPVFDVALATSDQQPDDDINFVMIDGTPYFPYSYADWSANPNNGEILGATVYFSTTFISYADAMLPDRTAATALPQIGAGSIAAIPPTASWGSIGARRLCDLTPFGRGRGASAPRSGGGAASLAAMPALTKKQKLEGYLTHVMAHEIGHTLGLRHNFEGSLVPLSSSIMDYVYLLDGAYYLDHPQAYDVDAVRYLYGLSSSLPAQPFCTDEDLYRDPECQQDDVGAAPLYDDWGPTWRATVEAELTGAPPPVLGAYSLNAVTEYVRAGATAEIQADAFALALPHVAAPISAADRAQFPALAGVADDLTRSVLALLFTASPDERGFITDDPAGAGALAAVDQLYLNLVNVDGVRSFATRRLCVDILKKIQQPEALQALFRARAAIAGAVADADPLDALQVADLLQRIDAATTRYFE